MKFKEYLVYLENLQNLQVADTDRISFNILFDPAERPLIGDWAQIESWSSPKNPPIPIRNDGIGNKSGIYFITDENEEVLYIGKASKNNLHERIWDLLQTPTGKEFGWRKFPNNKRKSFEIGAGKAKIGIVEILPAEASALAEVYLQTICLPPLCKQIG